ncbi:regulatory particle non-ATPase [Mucor velutinosus]|uniref:Regulatory particle non-ATPase n=1 Tax=Mucor velutinosus TaxID=708070 RepID=A0AAN7I1F8_9FUNG|nr:regulatory particle non-ATPase [Mucor velutinosus]
MATHSQQQPHQQNLKQNPNINKHDLPLSETDPKAAKQKSAEQKLQLFGAFQAMQKDGRMPHNPELDDLLGKLMTNKVISSREHLMSEDGRILLKDFRKLIGTMQKALNVKNKDELFQSLVYHLHCMESPINKEHINQQVKSTDKTAMQNEGKKASESMMQIGKLILLNNEFRSVLGELIDIAQDIFNSVAGKAGDSLQQAGSGLQDHNNSNDGKSGKHFVDNALDKALSHSNDNNNSIAPSHDHTQQHHSSSYHDREPHLVDVPKDDSRHQGLLNTGDSVHPNAIPGGFPTVNNNTAPGGGILGGHSQQQQAPQVPSHHTPPFDHNVDSHTAHNMSGEQPRQNYTEQIQNHPKYQQAQQHYNEHKEFAQNTVKEKVPKEKQDELLRRLQDALTEVQQHPEYQDAISTLIHLIQVWSSRLTKVSSDVMSKAKENDKPEQMNYREQSEKELKAIIECWAQGASIDPLLHGVQDVMRDMQNDEHLRDYYHTVMNYADRLLREPGYAQKDSSTEEGRKLMDQGNHIIKGRYKEHLNFLSSESRKYMNLMAEDEISKELHARIAKIHRDLWMDKEGNPAFKPQLLNDMRMTLLPAFIDEIKYIPIPRIEYSDPQYDIVIENLILSGDSLLPNVFDSKIESFNSFSLKSEIQSKPSHQTLFVRMSEIQAEIDDVVFFYKKKTGFPKLSDRGVASLTVGGKGISVATRITTVSDNPAKTFKVASCKCNVDNLKVKVNDSNHDILYKAIRPLVIGQVKKQVSRAIEEKVVTMINQLDQKVTKSIVKMNQDMQMKAYEALPEEEKARQQPPSVSMARPRPGLFSTVVNVINRNIKTKVQKRNEAKRFSRLSEDSGSSRPMSQFNDEEKRQVAGSTSHHMPVVNAATGGLRHSEHGNRGIHLDDSSQHSGLQHPQVSHNFPPAAEGGIQQYPQQTFGNTQEDPARVKEPHHQRLDNVAGIPEHNTQYASNLAGTNQPLHQQQGLSNVAGIREPNVHQQHGFSNEPHLNQQHGLGNVAGINEPHHTQHGLGNVAGINEPHHAQHGLGNVAGINEPHHTQHGLGNVAGINEPHHAQHGLGNVAGINEPHHAQHGLGNVAGINEPHHAQHGLGNVAGINEPHHTQHGLGNVAGIHQQPNYQEQQDYQPGYTSSNAASMASDRHNVVSPPASPPKKHDPNNFKLATDLSNAQNEYQQNQMSARQL